MKHSGDRQSIYKDLYLFARDLAGLFGWYLSYILDLYGILFQEKNYVSYKELGEASYLDFSFLKMPVCIPAGFHESWPLTGLIHKLTDALLMLFISDT